MEINNNNSRRSQRLNRTTSTPKQNIATTTPQLSASTSITNASISQSPTTTTATNTNTSTTTFNNSASFNSNENTYKKKHKYSNYGSFGSNYSHMSSHNGNNLYKSIRLNNYNDQPRQYPNHQNYNRNRRFYNKHRYANNYYSNNVDYTINSNNNNNNNINNQQWSQKRFYNNYKQYNNNELNQLDQSGMFNFAKIPSCCTSTSFNTQLALGSLTTSSSSSQHNANILIGLDNQSIHNSISSNSNPTNSKDYFLYSFDFSKLPNVVLTKIYSYLNLKDRLNASSVCKNWRMGLFNPCLWHEFDLIIYLCNKLTDLKSSQFKLRNFFKLAKNCVFKFDSNDLILIEHLANSLESIRLSNSANATSPSKALSSSSLMSSSYHATSIPTSTSTSKSLLISSPSSSSLSNNDSLLFNNIYYSSFINLKSLILQPIYNFYFDDDQYNSNNNNNNNNNSSCFEFENHNSMSSNKVKYDSFDKLNRRIFKSIKQIIVNSKSIENLSLGCLSDFGRSDDNILGLVIELVKKHKATLKSLHISTIRNASGVYLAKNKPSQQLQPSLLSSSSLSSPTRVSTPPNSYLNSPTLVPINKIYSMPDLIIQFTNLQRLSIDYDHLNDDLIRSDLFTKSLKKLNLNVNNILVVNELLNKKRNDSWFYTVGKNPSLRVTVNFLNVEETSHKYMNILHANMPLETLRMYFCKSFNPDIIQFLSNNYCETLQSLCVVDAITDPTLRYHNPLRFDADPDPLVLLCWKCRNLKELVVVGYEMLEINLIAIAKLRNNLKIFYVAMDCIIDLKYGQFRNDDFIEDEDGEDTIVDYGFCSDQVIDKVCKILGSQNWHPLEKDELPMCVYDNNVSYEEAYLDTLIKDQEQF